IIIVTIIEFDMRHFFLFICLSFFSIFSYAQESSYCDLSKGSISKEEYSACVEEDIKSNKVLAAIYSNAGESIVKSINLIFNFIKLNIELEETESDSIEDIFFAGVTFLMDAISKVVGVIFFIVIGVIGLITLLKTAKSGKVFEFRDNYFILFMLGVAVAGVAGGFKFVAFLFLIIGLTLFVLVWIIFSPILSNYLIYNVDAIKSELYSEAVVASDSIVESFVKSHISDIRFQNSLVFEHSTDIFPPNGWKITDYELLDCFNNDFKVVSVENSQYTSGNFLNSAECVYEKLGYKVYRMARIENISAPSYPIIKKIEEEQEAYRNLAFLIHKNNCVSVNLLDHTKISDYLGVCANRNVDSDYTLSENGFIQEFKDKTKVDSSKLKEYKTQLKKRLTAFIYAEMLKEGAKAKEKSAKNNSSEFISILNKGVNYRREFRDNGLKVIDFTVVDESVMKKNKLQESFDILGNISEFKAETENNTFNIQEYISSLSDEENYKFKVANIVDNVFGNAFTNLGFQYEDCYSASKCNSGEKNIIITINQAFKEIVILSTFSGVALSIKGDMKMRKATKLNSYDREEYANGQKIKSMSKFILGFAIIAVACILFIYKEIVLIFVSNFIMTLSAFIIMPALIVVSMIVKFVQVTLYKDDRYSLASIFIKFGVFDSIIRMPLLMLSMFVMIALMFVFSNIVVIVLFGVLAGSFNLLNPSSELAYLFTEIVAVFVMFIIYFAVMGKAFGTALNFINSMLNEFSSIQSIKSEVSQEVSKFKNALSRL
ncbi:hypothetical protein, partial [Pseudomonas aeruginosa]|uniref:hypothetical protein n=2 Tax=Pseudomonas aeruginosa TaxID=287 RepID=UPI00140F765B